MVGFYDDSYQELRRFKRKRTLYLPFLLSYSFVSYYAGHHSPPLLVPAWEMT